MSSQLEKKLIEKIIFQKNQWLPWDMDKESELLEFGKAMKI